MGFALTTAVRVRVELNYCTPVGIKALDNWLL